ncbi:MAG: hypothetical protein HOP02_12405, partial [Methylococcaceae bacterium]|nr:hypothetical protein [Methylococcaceae bacterium]
MRSNDKIDNIPTFMFLDSEFGGVSSLVIRLCRQFEISGISYQILDYQNGHIANHVRKFASHLGVINYLDNIKTHELQKLVGSRNVIIGFNGQENIFVKYFRKTEARFLIWDVYAPYWEQRFLKITDKPKFDFINHFFDKNKLNLLKWLLKNKTLIFMDNTGPETIKNLYPVLSPLVNQSRIIPLPVETALRIAP